MALGREIISGTNSFKSTSTSTCKSSFNSSSISFKPSSTSTSKSSFNSGSTIKSVDPKHKELELDAVREFTKDVDVTLNDADVHCDTEIDDPDVHIATHPIALLYCIPKLKVVLRVVFTIILLAYAVVIPMFIILFYRDSSDNVTKLDDLEKRWALHSEQESQVKIRASRDLQPDINNMYSHNSYNLKALTRKFNFLNDELQKYEARLLFFERLENWKNKAYNDNCYYMGCICKGLLGNSCKPGRTGLPGIRGSCICEQGAKGSTGPPGLQGSPGEEIELQGERGSTGRRGSEGKLGKKGEEGGRGSRGNNANCTCPKVTMKISTTYIRWGNQNCSLNKNNNRIYSGYIGSKGANYICLLGNGDPNYRLTYSKPGMTLHDPNRGTIDGVMFDKTVFPQNYIGTGAAVCAVCKVNGKSSMITIPATTECPESWTREYNGFLMSGSNARATDFICVDENLSQSKSFIPSDKTNFIANLKYVESRHQIYKSDANKVLACAVCTI